MERKTNGTVILEHLRDFGSITSFEAFTDYGITRLSAVIFDLKKAGYSIKTTDVYGTNRRGAKVRWAKYELVEETENGKLWNEEANR